MIKFYIKIPFLAFICTAFMLSSCMVVRLPGHGRRTDQVKPSGKRGKIVYTAQQFLGRRYISARGKRFHNDCSGLVAAVYYKNGYNLFRSNGKRQNMVKTIYDNVNRKGVVFSKGEVKPGDIVFFSNTYGRYGHKRFSHVGIVESIHEDSTISFIHRSSSGVVRDRMNLKKPHFRKDPRTGKILNSYLRRKRRSDPSNARYLTGELFESFGRIVD